MGTQSGPNITIAALLVATFVTLGLAYGFWYSYSVFLVAFVYAIGFDGKRTVGVWVGRADGAPVPGMIGRSAAAGSTGRVRRRATPTTAAATIPSTVPARSSMSPGSHCS